MKTKYLKNITGTSADLYIYGTIVDENIDFWTDEPNKMDLDPLEFKEELDSLNYITDLNIYINSPGGSVFASSTMVSMLTRAKQEKNLKIHGFIDGLCASAATYLLMVADDINVYKNSIMMIHKPMTFSMGNANDLQKDIDTLNTLENDLMLPMYMNKAIVEEEEIKELINKETWFNANEKSDKFIANYFNVNLLDGSKEVTACVSKDLFRNYKNVPTTLVVENEVRPKQQEVVDKAQSEEVIDYSYFDNKISSLKKGGE